MFHRFLSTPSRRSFVAITAAVVAVAVYRSPIMSAPDTSTETSTETSTSTTAYVQPTLSSTVTPSTFFLLGATGRTGIPFLQQALERGHTVHAYVRNPDKIEASLRSASNLVLHKGALNDAPAITRAISNAHPTVIVSMLASDPKPHDALSSGTQSVLTALRTLKEEKQDRDEKKWDIDRIAYISIAGMGIPSTHPYLSWFDRRLLSIGLLFLAAPANDMNKQLAMLDDAMKSGLLTRQTLVLPPTLTNGKLTKQYIAGDITTHHNIHLYHTISRSNMAHYILILCERVVAGEELPHYVTIRSA